MEHIYVKSSCRQFQYLSQSVFRMDTQQVSDLFMIFNVSGDGSMSKQEFVYCWNGWIKKVFLIPVVIIVALVLWFGGKIMLLVIVSF